MSKSKILESTYSYSDSWVDKTCENEIKDIDIPHVPTNDDQLETLNKRTRNITEFPFLMFKDKSNIKFQNRFYGGSMLHGHARSAFGFDIWAYGNKIPFIDANPYLWPLNKEIEALITETSIAIGERSLSVSKQVDIFHLLEKEISKSKYILELSDNFDDEGSEHYEVSTWNRAISFLRTFFGFMISNSINFKEIPKILNGPDGTIDIYWKKYNYSILINIPKISVKHATIASKNSEGEKYVGSFIPDNKNFNFISAIFSVSNEL